MSYRTTGLLLAALTGLSLALAAPPALRFSVNGKPAADAVTVNGAVYVPVSALRAAGLNITVGAGGVSLSTTATPAPAVGGANQMAAVEGCLNQTLFNGVWRMTVRSLTGGDVGGVPGWLVAVEMSNGTARTQNVFATGLDNSSAPYVLVTPNGDTAQWQGVATNYNQFAGQDVPQAGKINFVFRYAPRTRTATPPAPTKFLMTISTRNVNRATVPYSVPDPSFRVDLTCRK